MLGVPDKLIKYVNYDLVFVLYKRRKRIYRNKYEKRTYLIVLIDWFKRRMVLGVNRSSPYEKKREKFLKKSKKKDEVKFENIRGKFTFYRKRQKIKATSYDF